MNSPVQLKITLTRELQGLLRAKASRLGMPLTQYAKRVLIKDVKEEKYPVFKASKATIKAAEKALKELDQAVKITDVHEYFKNLK